MNGSIENLREKMLQEREEIISKFEQDFLWNTKNKNELKKNIVSKNYKDGSKYEGTLLKNTDIKEGKGIYYYTNNDVYLGDWKEDKFDGNGIYLFANGERYEG
jgi:hypothetical protein